jgi:hypothetical protein
MAVIPPEVAELLERREAESRALVKQSWLEYEDVVRRVRSWARETAESRVALARLMYTTEKCALLADNPVEYYKAPFPPFHEWLVGKKYELLRLSMIRQLFPANIEYGQLMDIMDVVRNNVSAHYLPRLVLVQIGVDDAAIVCTGD